METTQEFAYLGDRVSAGRGCEAAVTARTWCGWSVMGIWCDAVWQEVFSKAVYKSYVRHEILYGG